MNRRRIKPSITVAKVAGEYWLKVGANRVDVFRTRKQAVEAARELARANQGTLGPVAYSRGSSRLLPTNTTAKRVVRSLGGTTSSSKPRPDSSESESDVKPEKPGGMQKDRGKIEATIQAPAAHAWVSTELAQYMQDEDAQRRRKGILSGLGALSGLIGAIAAAVASIMNAAVSPGLDMTLFLGIATVAALIAGILTRIVPGLLRSRTTTSAWAAQVAGAVWDDEMAGTGEIRQLPGERGH